MMGLFEILFTALALGFGFLGLFIALLVFRQIREDDLVRRYRDRSRFDGPWKRFQSGKIGPVSFRKLLQVGIGADGIHLRGCLVFPPLHLPWSSVRTCHLITGVINSGMVEMTLEGTAFKVLLERGALDGAETNLPGL